MSLDLFFRSFVFTFLLAGIISVPLSPSWGGSSSKKKSDNGVQDITKGLKKKCNVSDDKKNKKKPKPKPLCPTTLIRTSNDEPIVCYAQELRVAEGKKVTLNRTKTQNSIQYVWNASENDGGKTLLTAQGIYRRATESIRVPFTVTQNFLGVLDLEMPSKKMVWVSHGSTASSDNHCVIRKPQEDYYGGHAEPQFISDLQAAFTKNSDEVIKKFMPSATDNHDDIYMCGLELFGPYDMCDNYNGVGNNKYNCVGKLIDFRKLHQSGQQSISQAIRTKLGDRFKGAAEEDAFVLIYHSKSPYPSVHTYNADDVDHEHYFPLQFNYDGCRFSPENPQDFAQNFQLSQNKNLTIEKDVIYGHIHNLADKIVNYIPDVGFSFAN